jgi:hypothetical protein
MRAPQELCRQMTSGESKTRVNQFGDTASSACRIAHRGWAFACHARASFSKVWRAASRFCSILSFFTIPGSRPSHKVVYQPQAGPRDRAGLHQCGAGLCPGTDARREHLPPGARSACGPHDSAQRAIGSPHQVSQDRSRRCKSLSGCHATLSPRRLLPPCLRLRLRLRQPGSNDRYTQLSEFREKVGPVKFSGSSARSNCSIEISFFSTTRS